jgi:DNA-binding MarR family transcriptional regulator
VTITTDVLKTSFFFMSEVKKQKLKLNQRDLNILWKLSLKGYRFLTCHHLSLLYFPSEYSCQKRMRQLRKAGLVQRCFTPVIHEKQKREIVYTLTRKGAKELAKALNISSQGLAGSAKFSSFFLEHSLRISNFMCSLETALRNTPAKLISWKSEKQLRSLKLKVSNPEQYGEKIPIVPDGLFSIKIGQRVENFFLEADRGTMPIPKIRKKMLGYIQLYRRGLHKDVFNLPHFRVLMITTNEKRRDLMMEELRDIGYCLNMFLFTLWQDIKPQNILGKIWLKCRGENISLLD